MFSSSLSRQVFSVEPRCCLLMNNVATMKNYCNLIGMLCFRVSLANVGPLDQGEEKVNRYENLL